jgi:hypothetical protein
VQKIIDCVTFQLISALDAWRIRILPTSSAQPPDRKACYSSQRCNNLPSR